MRPRDAMALIAGTAIGGGVLALPSVTTPIGFLPALVVMSAVWAFLALTSTAYAEAAARIMQSEAASGAPAGTPMEGFSVATLTSRAFGTRAAVVCSISFLAQMLAVLTAQVVKCGELLSVTARVPHVLGCVIPSAVAGLFVFKGRPASVEAANTALGDGRTRLGRRSAPCP